MSATILTSENIVAATLWQEARSLGAHGMIAVMGVIFNRLPKGPLDENTVHLCASLSTQPRQFSCWNDCDFGARMQEIFAREHAAADAAALKIAQRIAGIWCIKFDGIDITGGAVNYYDTSIAPPAWTAGMIETCVIGNLRFWRPR